MKKTGERSHIETVLLYRMTEETQETLKGKFQERALECGQVAENGLNDAKRESDRQRFRLLERRINCLKRN